MNKGIDYGNGIVNIDLETGIRYGVIPVHDVLQAWSDNSEAYYTLDCPECGQLLKDPDFELDACPYCRVEYTESMMEFIEPTSFFYKKDGYSCEQMSDMDIFILKSPYYTVCQFCSPCAPGAGYIKNTVEDGIKAYCFGYDWFQEQNRVPYPIYSVETGKLVNH